MTPTIFERKYFLVGKRSTTSTKKKTKVTTKLYKKKK